MESNSRHPEVNWNRLWLMHSTTMSTKQLAALNLSLHSQPAATPNQHEPAIPCIGVRTAWADQAHCSSPAALEAGGLSYPVSSAAPGATGVGITRGAADIAACAAQASPGAASIAASPLATTPGPWQLPVLEEQPRASSLQLAASLLAGAEAARLPAAEAAPLLLELPDPADLLLDSIPVAAPEALAQSQMQLYYAFALEEQGNVQHDMRQMATLAAAGDAAAEAAEQGALRCTARARADVAASLVQQVLTADAEEMMSAVPQSQLEWQRMLLASFSSGN